MTTTPAFPAQCMHDLCLIANGLIAAGADDDEFIAQKAASIYLELAVQAARIARTTYGYPSPVVAESIGGPAAERST